MTLLLDTHAAIWLSQGEPMSADAIEKIDRTRNGSRVLLSAVSVWEISNLIAKQRVILDWQLGEWVRRFVKADGFDSVSLSIPMAIEAAKVPADLRDPADRFLVATARHLGVPLVTRDSRILKLAKAGYVQAVAC